MKIQKQSITKGSTLKAVEMSAIGTAKDGRNFFTATFSPGFGQLPVKRNFWQQFKKDGKTGLPTTEKYWERGTPAEMARLIESGELIAGEKVTRSVEAYELGVGENKRTVSSYSTAVFPGEDIVSVFASASHNIVDEETGEVLGKPVATLGSNKKEGELAPELTPAAK